MRAQAIEKHPNGRYYLCYMERGKRLRAFLGTTEREARRKVRVIRAAHEAGQLLDNGQPTSRTVLPTGERDMNLKELIVRHLAFVKANKSEGTFVLRQRNALYLLEFLGARPVSSITADDLQRFADWIKTRHVRRNEGGWHPIRECKTMFHWAQRAELISFPISRFPSGSERRASTKRFTTEEMGKLLAATKGEFADMVRFGAMMGLRPKELRELRHDQIDWEAEPRPLLVIEHHKTFQTSRVPTPRSVPLPDTAIEILRHQRQRHPKSKIVFLNGDGRPFERTAFRNRLLRACRRAEIEEKSPYSLRHYAGTQLAQRTGLSTVAHILGHSNIQTTMRYIANNEPAHLKAMEDMANLVDGLAAKPDGKIVPLRPAV